MISECPVILNLRVLDLHGHDREIRNGFVDLRLVVVLRGADVAQQLGDDVGHCLIICAHFDQTV
jgi:hypothetical protein